VNIAILSGPDDEKLAASILQAINALGIKAYALRIRDTWRDLKPSILLSYFERATHTVAICSSAALSSSWIAFASGYAYGKRTRMALFRVDANRALPEFLSRLPVLDSVDEISSFFISERLEWARDEGRQAARDEILSLGLSFSAESFASSAAEGDLHAAELFLAAGFSPDTKDKHGVPLLSVAVRNRRSSVIEFLCERGADIDAVSDDRGYSPLMDASALGDIDTAGYLLERGAKTSTRSKDGQTALVIAVGRNDVALAQLLLMNGADPDVADKLGFSARKYARLFHDPDMMRLFEEEAPR
jgi:hypothetical protein